MNTIQKEKTYEIDMVNAPFLRKIFLFAVPLILTSLLQLLFNSADLIVVGQYAGKQSFAAVGATTMMLFFIIQTFTGISVGSSVTMSRYYGAGDENGMEETAHTTMLFALITGIVVSAIGIAGARAFLIAMKTPDDILDRSILYARVYFIGTPAFVVYSFGASLLRAVGDTRRPLYYLSATGALNVVLNLIFVIIFDLDVAGVALATIISQYLSAVLILRCLIRSKSAYGIRIRSLRIVGDKLLMIIKIGLPAGIQSALFSGSNVIIQSAVNTFNSSAVAGVSASSSFIEYMFAFVTGFSQACTAFIAASIGAGRGENTGKLTRTCLLLTVVFTSSLSLLSIVFAPQVISIFNTDPDVLAFGAQRIYYVFPFYVLYACGDVLVGAMRGFGSIMKPTVVTTVGMCGVRILWIFTVFASHHTLPVLHMSYGISWIITIVAHSILYIREKRKLVDSVSAAPAAS